MSGIHFQLLHKVDIRTTGHTHYKVNFCSLCVHRDTVTVAGPKEERVYAPSPTGGSHRYLWRATSNSLYSQLHASLSHLRVPWRQVHTEVYRSVWNSDVVCFYSGGIIFNCKISRMLQAVLIGAVASVWAGHGVVVAYRCGEECRTCAMLGVS